MDVQVKLAGDPAAGVGELVEQHDVRRVLPEAQAAALGLPLHVVELPWPCPNPVYEQLMSAAMQAARRQDVSRNSTPLSPTGRSSPGRWT
ncbi:MAG: hypothetical protein WAK82_01645 [Streptosporangiaceae bacterium]